MLQTSGTICRAAGRGDLLSGRGVDSRNVRGEVTKVLEAQREAGKIGSSAAGRGGNSPVAATSTCAAGALGDDLKLSLIVSAAKAFRCRGGCRRSNHPARHAKCERCWHVRGGCRRRRRASDLCGRCVSNLHGGRPACRADFVPVRPAGTGWRHRHRPGSGQQMGRAGTRSSVRPFTWRRSGTGC